MFTDMVDYTAMSEKDEALALTLLEEHRQLLHPVFARHGGREVKTIGDGFLVEFPSALEAVRCALEIQQLMSKRNQSVPSERKRSEEHTSELQSLTNLVCRLLLEK